MSERVVLSPGSATAGTALPTRRPGPLYVPYGLPGETVTVEKLAGDPPARDLLQVESASAERMAPVCRHFGVCGGCAVQHWTRYREWKRNAGRRCACASGHRRGGR